MTTAAPKLPRRRWLAIRSTPKRFPLKPLREIKAGVYEASDGARYSRSRDSSTGKLGPLVGINRRPRLGKAGVKARRRALRELRAAGDLK